LKFLLDACVISALRRPREHASLAAWINEVDESDLYLSVITLGELEKGVSRLPQSRKKALLSQWLRHDVTKRFADRLLPIDAAVAACWGELLAAREKKGRPMPILDAFIAATAIAAGFALVTKNTKDFEDCGVRLLNP
jgi:predicted nucleic acid-binding protein